LETGNFIYISIINKTVNCVCFSRTATQIVHTETTVHVCEGHTKRHGIVINKVEYKKPQR